jgi:hypothetical protein
MNDIRQQLFEHDWTSKYPFLQQPVIDIYPADNLLEVVVHTGGRAIAESKGIQVNSVTPSPDPALVEQFDVEAPLVAIPDSVKSESGHDHLPEESLAGDFAPVDVKHASEVASEDRVTQNEDDNNLLPATSFGVPITAEHLSQHKKETHHSSSVAEHHSPHAVDTGSSDHTSLRFLFFNIPHKLHLKAVVPFIVVGMLVGLGLLYATAVFAASSLLKAHITLELNSQPISKDTSLTLDSTVAGSDVANKILKADVVTKEMSGEKTAPATGTKIIGDKSKGKVTLFNRTSSSKTFAAGTTLTAGKLKYVLDGPVTVASASTGQNFETKPGTAEANMTASQIGAESNLDNNTDMTVESFGQETYVARTTSEIAGGSSREILAVSQQDRDKLLADLRKELTDQAVEQFKSEAGVGKYIVPTGNIKIVERKYSAEVGKEVNTFSLQLTIQVEALTYQVDDLKPLVLELLKGDIPSGYQLANQDPQILSAPATAASGSGKIVLDANVSAVAVPVINEEQLKAEITGKPNASVQQILEEKPEITSAQVVLTPSVLTFFSQAIPQVKNIVFEIKDSDQ